MALVSKDAAMMIRDADAVTDVFPAIETLLADPDKLLRMSQNMLSLGIADSADRIVDEILNVVGKKK